MTTTTPHDDPTLNEGQPRPLVDAETMGDLFGHFDDLDLTDDEEGSDAERLDADTPIGREGDSSEVRGTVAEVFAAMKEGEQKQVKVCPFCPHRPLPKGDSVMVKRTAHGLVVTVWGAHGHKGEKNTKGGKVVSSHFWHEPLPAFSRGDHVELGRDLAKTIHPGGGGKAVYTSRHGFRMYDPRARSATVLTGGAWVPVDERVVEKRVHRYSGRLVVSGTGENAKSREITLRKTDILGIVHVAENELFEADDHFDSPWIGFRNGNYNPHRTDHAFEEPAPHHRVMAEHVLPYNFDLGARSERWEAFLAAAIPDEGSRLFLQELVGACLHGKAAEWAVHAILEGKPSSGKSTFLSVVEALFPSGARASASPSGWVSPFGLTTIADVKVNVVAELNTDELRRETALMRRVLTGDSVQIERKHRDAFTARVKAGHIYACNELPASGDSSGGLFRRFRVVQFPNVFKHDDAFGDALRSSATLSAVYAWAKAGYERRLKAGAYTLPGTHNAHLDEWKKKSDNVYAWAADHLVPDPSAKVMSSELFRRYRAWCEDNGFEGKNSTNFGISLKRDFAWKDTAKGTAYQVRYVVDESALREDATLTEMFS